MFLVTGCTVATVPVADRSPAGSFLGVTEDHRAIRLTISEAPQGFVGYGNLDGADFSVTFLTSYRGVGLLTHDGRFLPLEIELSFDGERLILDAPGTPAELHRIGTAETPGDVEIEGGIAGRYHSGGSGRWIGELELTRKGNLVLGSGSVYGQPFVLSGILDGADSPQVDTSRRHGPRRRPDPGLLLPRPTQ